MKYKNLLASAAVVVIVSLAACSGSKEPVNNPTPPTPPVSVGEVDTIYLLNQVTTFDLTAWQRGYLKKTNDFGFNLCRAIQEADTEGRSLFCSPMSVSYMLGMLANGAAGQCYKEIADALGYGQDDVMDINELLSTLLHQAPNADKKVTIEVANGMFINQQYKLNPTFRNQLMAYYDAELSNQDFSSPNALKAINGWCNDKSHGLIPTILDELDPKAMSVLLNAIYFKGAWAGMFKEENTTNSAFTLADGSTVTLPIMHRKALAYYYEDEQYTSLRLPYGNGGWAMQVLLPNEGYTTGDILRSLTAASWDTHCMQRFGQSERYKYTVDILLPRFTTEAEMNLKEPLTAMGVSNIFSDMADMPNLCQGYSVHVSKMLQKAYVNVSEEGTEAAAVTTSVITGNSATPHVPQPVSVDFHATRPFLYLITEESTNAVFFVGMFNGK